MKTIDDVGRHVVISISEFVQCIKKIQKIHTDELWFRGHSKASYKLLPVLYRDPFIFHDSEENPYKPKKGDIVFLNEGGYKGFSAKRLLKSFKEEYQKKSNVLYQPQDDFEWLCLMQHYGIPTRLLDWSTNAFTALFFALKGAKKTNHHKMNRPAAPDVGTEKEFDGAVVFVILPKQINAMNIHSKKPIDSVLALSEYPTLINQAIFPHDSSKAFFRSPICVSSQKFDFRILAQQGVFILFGKSNFELDYLLEMKTLIHKIFIPKYALFEMSNDLQNLGITTNTIFPDLDKSAIIAKNRLNKDAEKIITNEENYIKHRLNLA